MPRMLPCMLPRMLPRMVPRTSPRCLSAAENLSRTGCDDSRLAPVTQRPIFSLVPPRSLPSPPPRCPAILFLFFPRQAIVAGPSPSPTSPLPPPLLPGPPALIPSSTTGEVPIEPLLVPPGAASSESSNAGPGVLPLAPWASWKTPPGTTWTSMPTGQKKSRAYDYFVAEYNSRGTMNATHFICVHRDHQGLPMPRVAHANGTANQRRHLKNAHGIEAEMPSASDALALQIRARVGAEQQRPATYFGAAPLQYPSGDPAQKKFYAAQLEMLISTLSPEAIVDDPAYVAMTVAANLRLSTLSQRSLSRALGTRWDLHTSSAREKLSHVGLCHVSCDRWTSLANEPFASFVVTWIDDEWRLRSAVLHCCIFEGRHTASAIAAFFLRVAREFILDRKIGVARTDGAADYVGAGQELGEGSGQPSRSGTIAAGSGRLSGQRHSVGPKCLDRGPGTSGSVRHRQRSGSPQRTRGGASRP